MIIDDRRECDSMSGELTRDRRCGQDERFMNGGGFEGARRGSLASLLARRFEVRVRFRSSFERNLDEV
jgi:hypothetical protein